MKQQTRRKFVRLALMVPPVVALAACGEQSPTAQSLTTTTAASTTQAAATTSAITTATATTAAKTTTTAAPATTTQAATTAPATTTQAATTVAQVLPPTPQCSSKAATTIAETEGPYFKPSSPLRTSLLESGITGTKLVVTGYVLSTSCQPVKNALVDFWQADANGQYDSTGFKMRGHQFTDDTGKFYLETVIPGLYPGRTRHIHVKVQAPSQPILTTQLFFPGEARNQTDGIFHQSLLMQVQDITAGAKQGNFNFVLSL